MFTAGTEGPGGPGHIIEMMKSTERRQTDGGKQSRRRVTTWERTFKKC